MPLSLNVEPYYDDFDASKNYHKILFVPSRPIQARELTQIQSILQNQIKLNADYMFKNGAMVIPGAIDYISKAIYVKLTKIHNNIDTDSIIESFLGKKIIGSITNVKASIIHVEKSTETDYPTIFISYLSGGVAEDGTLYRGFMPDEELSIIDDSESAIKTINYADHSGYGTLASITEGVYYINGYFVQNLAQTISLDKYGTTPSYKVGFNFIENIITSSDDKTLRDTAIDSSNYGAAGADRYQIQLSLIKKPLLLSDEDVTTTDQFIDLMHVKTGTVQYKNTRTELNEFEKTLARRTYDESGDYIVESFNITINEYRNNNRGTHVADRVYLEGDIVSFTDINYDIDNPDTIYYAIAQNNGVSGNQNLIFDEYGYQNNGGTVIWLATKKPQFNKGYYVATDIETIDQQINNSQIGLYKISSGKAYIKGYEISTQGFKTVPFTKARTYKNVEGHRISSEMGQYFIINDLNSFPKIDIQEELELHDYLNILIGYCRVKNISYQYTDSYKLYVSDINFLPGKKLSQIKFITGSSMGATIVGEKVQLSGKLASIGTAINGYNTLFTSELTIGDTISNDTNGEVTYITGITNSIKATINSAYTADITEYTTYYLEKTVIYGNPSYMKKLDHSFVRSLRGSDDTTLTTTYYVNKIMNANGITPVTIVLDRNGDTFASPLGGNYLFINAGIVYTSSSATFVFSPDMKTLTLSDFIGNEMFTEILYTVKRESQSAKEKYRSKMIYNEVFDTYNTAILSELKLEKVAHKILAIKHGIEKFDPNTPNAIVAMDDVKTYDITHYYTLTSDSNSQYYTPSKLVAKNGYIPTGPIVVIYEAYVDSGGGDYFSIDSYSGIPYRDMVTYDGFSIGDYLDFRTGKDKNGAITKIPTPLSTYYPIELDYSFYLPRRDIIQINTKGNFRIEQGLPSDQPTAPIQNDDHMIISYADMAPYTVATNANNIKLKPSTLRRYTMRDIGLIDNRLKDAEYYVALTNLEKATSDLQIKDENGLDRYKNGFITDQFKDHGVGDYSNQDYKCAVDPQAQECRPTFYSDSVKLLENLIDSRASKKYQITGDIVTLPYTEVVLQEQKLYTTGDYILPYTRIHSMNGDLNLYPASDTWVDTETLPDIEQKSEGTYDVIKAIASKTGILGTVWNSWQTESRKTISTADSTVTTPVINNNAFGGGSITSTTVNTHSGTDLLDQSRTGTNTTMQERWDEVGRVTGIVDTSWSPWMREKAIVLHCKKMMPHTYFNLYIDNVALTNYVWAADTIFYKDKTGVFLDYVSSSIDQEDVTARQYGDNSYDLLDRGEVIKGSSSGATAVLVCDERQYNSDTSTSENVLRVLNVKGTFVLNEDIVGQTSGATAKFTSLLSDPSLEAIRTSSAGTFYGILLLPNNSAVRIRAGIITISLRDDVVIEDASTSAEAKYDGHGLIQQRQTTIMSVRNATLNTENLSDTQQVTENWSNESKSSAVTTFGAQSAPVAAAQAAPAARTAFVANPNQAALLQQSLDRARANAMRPVGFFGGDPIAQSFKHNDAGGVFITAVDVYFHTVDNDPTETIFLQIKEMINGYPGPTVLPFSNVTKFAHEITASKTDLIPTKFIFQSPVYIKQDVEYCITIGANSGDTKIWMAKMGEASLDGRMVMEQPNAGSFFRSQNNSTWDTDQMTDLTFTIYKAKFDTSTGLFSMKNSEINKSKLGADPFRLTAGNTMVRVAHNNHGLINGNFVTYSGAVSLMTHPTTVELNNIFKVSNVELDTYTIELPIAAVISGNYGGYTVMATANRKIDTMYLNGNDIVLPETHIEYVFRTCEEDRGTLYLNTNNIGTQIKRNMSFDYPKYIMSAYNEQKFIGGEKSFIVDAYLYSTNENISPVMDLPTYAVYTITNKINNPDSTTNQSIDRRAIISLDVADIDSFEGSVITINLNDIEFDGNIVPSLIDSFNTFKIGRYVTFNDNNLFSNINAPNKIVGIVSDFENQYFKLVFESELAIPSIIITDLGSTPIVINQYDHYVDFISPESTSNMANYITRNIELSKLSTGFKLLFDYNKPANTFIDIYYKTALKANYTKIEKLNWTLLEDPTPYQDVQKFDSVIEHDIQQDKIIINGLETDYDQIMIKVVFKSNNTAKIPRIKNLRLIALA